MGLRDDRRALDVSLQLACVVLSRVDANHQETLWSRQLCRRCTMAPNPEVTT